jgi:hypothetical protein
MMSRGLQSSHLERPANQAWSVPVFEDEVDAWVDLTFSQH